MGGEVGGAGKRGSERKGKRGREKRVRREVGAGVGK